MKEITVTMPIKEYNRLKAIEEENRNDIRMFEHCNQLYFKALDKNIDAKMCCLTDELLNRIKNIYL